MKLKEELEKKNRQLEQFNQQLNDKDQLILELQSKISEKIARNKNLHEKIGDISSKNQQLRQQVDQQKRIILNIQNQNEFLLRAISTHEIKQSQIIKQCENRIFQSQKQMAQKDRSKQAFARRCQQLKGQNQDLIKRFQILQRKLILAESKKNNFERQVIYQRQRERSKENINSTQYQLTNKSTQNLKKQNKQTTVNNTSQLNDIQKIVDQIIKVSLSLKKNQGLTLKQKLQHINNFVSYRLKHIECILQEIINKMQIKATLVKGPELKQIHLLSIRLETYLHELLK